MQKINQRLDLLLLVLQYDSQEINTLSTVDRIHINQERGHLLAQLKSAQENPEYQVDWFSHTTELDEAIYDISRSVQRRNWTPKEY